MPTLVKLWTVLNVPVGHFYAEVSAPLVADVSVNTADRLSREFAWATNETHGVTKLRVEQIVGNGVMWLFGVWHDGLGLQFHDLG
jgi:hypothetical protein